MRGGLALAHLDVNPLFARLSPKVRWILSSGAGDPVSGPSGDPRGESFWSHFGDILESILETFWSPFWNGKLTCRAPKGSSPTPAYCCIAVSGLPGFCTGGTRTLPFLPTQRIVSQVTPQRVANLLRALLSWVRPTTSSVVPPITAAQRTPCERSPRAGESSLKELPLHSSQVLNRVRTLCSDATK